MTIEHDDRASVFDSLEKDNNPQVEDAALLNHSSTGLAPEERKDVAAELTISPAASLLDDGPTPVAGLLDKWKDKAKKALDQAEDQANSAADQHAEIRELDLSREVRAEILKQLLTKPGSPGQLLDSVELHTESFGTVTLELGKDKDGESEYRLALEKNGGMKIEDLVFFHAPGADKDAGGIKDGFGNFAVRRNQAAALLTTLRDAQLAADFKAILPDTTVDASFSLHGEDITVKAVSGEGTLPRYEVSWGGQGTFAIQLKEEGGIERGSIVARPDNMEYIDVFQKVRALRHEAEKPKE